MNTNQKDCQNCEQPFDDGFHFCPSCGQKTNEDLTLGILFYNTISNYFSFDARFLKSFLPLMFKPGYLAKRFLEGKRLLYLHPAQMYLFVSVVFFFIFSFTVSDWTKEANILNQRMIRTQAVNNIIEESQVKLDSTEKEEILSALNENRDVLALSASNLKLTDSVLQTKKSFALETLWDFNKAKVDSLITAYADDAVIYKEMGMPDDAGYFTQKIYKTVLNVAKGNGVGSILQNAFDAVPVAMFILLPLFAFLLKLFYFKSGRYAHHLVFSFYFFSFLFLLFGILLGINRFLFTIPTWISWLIMLSTFFYFYLSVLKFYERNWFTSLLKSSVITFIFLLMIIPTAGILLIIFGFVNV